MKQLTQQLKSGHMELLEAPFPALDAQTVLVRNHYSVISAGTEGKSVRDARRGYLSKARTRQKEVKQVFQAVKLNGFSQTYDLVMNKLEAPSALGYNCAGVVIRVGSDVTEFAVGDRVACGGNSAVHAEVVAARRHLCVKVADHVDLRHAAFTTIGAVALQGIRQAEVGIGSNCLVIGLGLVGLLSMQLLEAAGIRAIGVDVDPDQVDLARRAGAVCAFTRDSDRLEETILHASRGRGVDAVIISASTDSIDPVELAGRVSRQKGRVVVVGAVPTGFSREQYYRKELDLRMSCSYGPGRYDPTYEERGVDYPIGYVRWTENRNMQAFVDLLEQRKISLEPLITHAFPFERATEAYDVVLARDEPIGGVLLEYDVTGHLDRRVKTSNGSRPVEPGPIRAGFIGAGSFATNILLPVVENSADLVGVATARPNNARYVADKFGFDYCTGDVDDILLDGRINVVFIATRHNLHASQVIAALEAGKHVFVEKPLCLSIEELEAIETAYAGSDRRLMVGFNRRFAPLVRRMKERLPDEVPMAINYRINAGTVPLGHWIHDPAVGGGRIVGELCHFIDLAAYIADAPIVSVCAQGMDDPFYLHDTLSAQLAFSNGSMASISYFSNGSKRLSKEYLEVFCAGQVAVIDDFRTLTVHGEKTSKQRLRSQDKGHVEEIRQFLHAVTSGEQTPIPVHEILATTRATFKIREALRSGQTMVL
ncbi:MAG TPA: bi-domain-containing oxidoreductase [Rhodothermales bacterium]|nr:bi-domain-containing oxidoreductase [Rhodothermales bacterium]